jgi:RND family efflux transporter MFP subunit
MNMMESEFVMETMQNAPSRSDHPAGTAHSPSQNGAAPHDHDEVDLNVPKPNGVWVLLAAVVAIVLLGTLLLVGGIPRRHQAQELSNDANEASHAPVTVNVAKPRRAPNEVTINIPGNLRPWQEVSIFARTTGYLRKYYVDISEPVKAGQLMAEIDSPEVDQELGQVQAALEQSKTAVAKAATDRDLAKVTLNRFESLKETHSVSLQDLDEKQAAMAAAEANLQAAKANVSAAEANLRRLTEMKSFERVIAPFSGVCTGRAYDVGSLITANPTVSDTKPMFKIAQNDILRAFVNVPQSAALQIKKGQEVKVTVRERPSRIFLGKVMGTTNYLDAMNRSLLTEVKIQNTVESDGSFALLPGMYVQCGFTIKRDTPPLMVPAPSLVNNSDGTQIAVVTNGTAHFKKVTLGEDFGSEVEITSGLNGDEQIIANPGERIVEGAAVLAPKDATAEATPAPALQKVSQIAKD